MATDRNKRSRSDQILDAAVRCFSTKGFVATTMEDVRRESKASIGSIYHHFKSKEQLALAIYARYMNPFMERQLAALLDHRTPKSSLTAMIVSYLEWVEANPEIARFLFYSAPGQEVRAVAMEELAESASDPFRKVEEWFVEQARVSGIKRLPVELYGAIVLGPVHSFAQRWLSGRSTIEVSVAAKALAGSAWRSLKP